MILSGEYRFFLSALHHSLRLEYNDALIPARLTNSQWICNACLFLMANCARGLAVLEGLGVVSASHDQTLKVWTFEGDCIATLSGHTALVYR